MTSRSFIFVACLHHARLHFRHLVSRSLARRIHVRPATMNAEKLSKLQAQVRIGGKGTARRKKKIVHRTAMTDDKKLQSSLKKLSVNMIPGIEEVNMIKDDGTVIHFNNPKVQASLTANTFAISGQNETKQITEMLPGILNQLGADSLTHLRRLASNVQAVGHKRGAGPDATLAGSTVTEEEEVPVLVGNFDDPSKTEGVTIRTGSSELIIQEEVSTDSEKKESKETEDKKGEGDKEEKKDKTEKKEERKEKREGKEDKKESKQ